MPGRAGYELGKIGTLLVCVEAVRPVGSETHDRLVSKGAQLARAIGVSRRAKGQRANRGQTPSQLVVRHLAQELQPAFGFRERLRRLALFERGGGQPVLPLARGRRIGRRARCGCRGSPGPGAAREPGLREPEQHRSQDGRLVATAGRLYASQMPDGILQPESDHGGQPAEVRRPARTAHVRINPRLDSSVQFVQHA